MIDERDLERMKAGYLKRLAESKDEYYILGWGLNPQRNHVRRNALLRPLYDFIAKGEGTVLDIGCGTGLLGMFIKEINPDIDYIGIELLHEFAEMARFRNVGEIIEADISRMDSLPLADWIIIDGVFNFRFEYSDNLSEAMTCFDKAFKAASQGTIISFMGRDVDFRENHIVYFDETEIYKAVKSLTNRLTLYHDMPVYEFWIAAYPPFKGWREC